MISLSTKNKVSKVIGVAACAIMLLDFLPTATLKVAAEKQPKSDRIIVSLGDSYSSGEGIDNFYDYDKPIKERVNSEDWLAHRSMNSWGGQLRLHDVDGKMADSGNKDVHWFFVAASGAETKHFNKEKQKKEYYKKTSLFSSISGTRYLPLQLSVFDKLKKEGKDADYVTLTIGGNDVGFVPIVTKAALESNYLNFGAYNELLDMLFDPLADDHIEIMLENAYREIHSKTDAKIIVAGYPKLFNKDGEGMVINKYEASAINKAVHIFNLKIHNAVMHCNMDDPDSDIYHFVTVEEEFGGHEAYSKDSWMNGIDIGSKDQDLQDNLFSASAYSMHPNFKGAQAYARCVQRELEELEDEWEKAGAVRTTSDERDIVLVLDVSGSMDGQPISETRNATAEFIETAMHEDASVGIVTYNYTANMLADFSMNEDYLKEIAGRLRAGGGTNIEDGLLKAREMLDSSNAKKKIIVLMSDGEPNNGKVGEDLISYANEIKQDGTYIYTLGFFGNLGMNKSSAQYLMENIASDGCHYEVASADDLRFFFGDIADQINGTKYIYVRIACPVDVSVSYGGEKLSSSGEGANTRTSFGTLTFEESEEQSENSTDDRVKILRLKEGVDYDIKIRGNGTGSMDYTIGFMDENGEYSDLRKFKNVKIKKRTKIDTVANNADKTVMNVDTDGDGKYDITYEATANSNGKKVDNSYIYRIIYISICSVAGIILLIVILIFIKKYKNRPKTKPEAKPVKAEKKKDLKKKYCLHCGSSMPGDKKFCTNCGKPL